MNFDISFDLEKAKLHAINYHNSTNVGCMIINNKGDCLFNTVSSNNVCLFCEKIKNYTDYNFDCAKSHLYGAYEAERFGGKYIFFCKLGLTHWASPIIYDGIMQGAFLGGPVLMVDADDFIYQDIIVTNIVDKKYINEVKSFIKEVPFKEPKLVTSLTELLFIISVFVSDIKPSDTFEDIEYIKNQSYFYNYLNYLKTMGGEVGKEKIYPIKKEKELLNLVAIGDKQNTKKILNEILGHVYYVSKNNINIAKARVLELVVLLSRAAIEGGGNIETVFGLNYKYLSQINSFTDISQLSVWLSKIMTRFIDSVFNLSEVKHVDILYKALDFIKNNYMKKISLMDIAEYVYISPSYLSKLFKEELKYNFNSYLNKVRVDISKKLLKDYRISLINIALTCGFEDQSYFSKVFKRFTGMSPGRYRESILKK